MRPKATPQILRVFLFVVALSSIALSGGALQLPVASAAPVAMVAPAEDAATQGRTLSEAYNLLLDHYVHPLDTAALLGAGWDNLTKEADGKAAAPGPAPSFVGNRAADLQTIRDALDKYLARPNANPDGFVATHALIRGMVHYIDEGHTFFLDPQQYHDYEARSRGDDTYVGIGIAMSDRDGQPRIVEVYEDTPAQQVGLQVGDTLVNVSGQSVQEMALDQITGLVRGPVGTNIEMDVRRGDSQLHFSVPRAEIHLQLVSDKVVQSDIGYVMLRGFPEPGVIDSVENDIAEFQAEGVRGLVLDLRGNPGGRIDVGTTLLSKFLPNGSSIYQELDRGGQNSTHQTRGDSQYDMPLVVLVDGGTASMGEIFAAAVQEHGAATIVGTNTAGSVAAAQVFGLPDGSGVQVTVFEILSADGKPLNKVGVTPDEVINGDPAAIASGGDPVLARAVDILQDEVASNGGATP